MIRTLDEKTIQKIAAGEVVERPVSVVKELVENAIDAGADEIDITIEEGGKKRILVSDNGSGIAKEEMETAFYPHATSKISSFDDLYRLHSLGFRGEALPSIIAISRVEARSKTADQEMGLSLVYEDGKLVDRKPIAMSTGTQMQVFDLFSHVPVRLKFMKSAIAEANAIVQFVYQTAIGHPDLAFRLFRDDRRVLQTSKHQTLEDTLLMLYGTSYHDALRRVSGENDHYRVTGVVGDNTFYRANRSMQFLFVNGRGIDDKAIRDAVETSYHSVIPNGRFPAFQLFIETDPANLDVNIHPNKRTIQFTEGEGLVALVQDAVRAALAAPKIPANVETDDSLFGGLSTEESYRHILAQYAWPTKEAGEPNTPPIPMTPIDSAESGEDDAEDEDLLTVETVTEAVDDSVEEETPTYLAPQPTPPPVQEHFFHEEEHHILVPLERLRYVGALFRVYLLFEEIGGDTLYILDQHAAHERINFERFLRQAKAHAIVRQPLLFAVKVPVTEAQMAAFDARRDLLDALGFSAEPFGEETLLLRTVPTLFQAADLSSLFLELLDIPLHDMTEYDRLLHEVATRACRASVKQGDALSSAESLALYAQLEQTDYPLTCPHGRPTIIKRTRYDFEKWFMRVK
ncbi:MAG: DNA mismatch repair endonuclease MutL [Peptoniphilaceae bacterium]|nr:DNA mismatch repair endonuclease MutL [Peptoniphilaceae bacterium]MDY6086035.1 DNA mismatch repair endonuclease MutL [Peptoniphilaceae bacterium]